MDVDGPAASNDITFSSEAKQGKRSAANLPVEAEDSLPWCVLTASKPTSRTNNPPPTPKKKKKGKKKRYSKHGF